MVTRCAKMRPYEIPFQTKPLQTTLFLIKKKRFLQARFVGAIRSAE